LQQSDIGELSRESGQLPFDACMWVSSTPISSHASASIGRRSCGTGVGSTSHSRTRATT
jgi:hypothetical protein